MTYLAILELLLKYGPTAVSMGQKIVAAIKAGKGNAEVSDADWVELNRLASQSAEDIYRRLGIEPPPPPKPPAT